MKKLVEIYRCSKKEGLYLYVNRGQKLEDLPESLLQSLGKTELAMSLSLDKQRKLAQVDVVKVLEALEDAGYFLQLPPSVSVEEQLGSST
ncbi:YcgL domain-containing protein [Agaribacterium haliotis]|uniref:YcgL domain-containing protein n=1 Tax=Agaribacterium haliotis TaxID=2013869 RepID=UPI000BB5727D|nr:YcgL domain-containing protein [Agaribacterium haliotis]